MTLILKECEYVLCIPLLVEKAEFFGFYFFRTWITEKTIGLLLGPFTALHRLFPKHCTYKGMGTACLALSKPPQRQQGLL